MALTDLQARLRRTRGTRYRRDVVNEASTIPGAPDTLTEQRLRMMETALQAPPRDGDELRAITAALGISLFVVLRDLDYWPPFASPSGRPTADDLLDELQRLGTHRVTRAGAKFVIEPL